MSASFGLHNVARIEAFAFSDDLSSSRRMHVQNLELYDKEDKLIGSIALYLDQPSAAIHVGKMEKLDK